MCHHSPLQPDTIHSELGLDNSKFSGMPTVATIDVCHPCYKGYKFSKVVCTLLCSWKAWQIESPWSLACKCWPKSPNCRGRLHPSQNKQSDVHNVTQQIHLLPSLSQRERKQMDFPHSVYTLDKENSQSDTIASSKLKQI